MHISGNPLARKPVIPRKAPENLRSIHQRGGGLEAKLAVFVVVIPLETVFK